MESLFSNIQHIIRNQQGLAFIAAFVAGLVSAASPCVLAAIPLIIGYVGGYSEGNRKKAALYSLVFILGLSITFTLLGAAASAMGSLLGALGRWPKKPDSEANTTMKAVVADAFFGSIPSQTSAGTMKFPPPTPRSPPRYPANPGPENTG